MSLKLYEYKACGTCKKAKVYLDKNAIEYKIIPIRETPPNKTEIKKMIKYMDGNIKKLFNTSGVDYRSQNIKEKIVGMSEAQMIELLNSNGNLIKRPFLIGKDFGVTGFKEEIWDSILL